MKKKEIKQLFKEYQIKKTKRLEFDYEFNGSYIKLLNTNSNTQLTINSPTVYQIHTGKVDGIRFVRKNSVITRFKKTDKLILVLLNKPYRILKYINENEVVDISNEEIAHGIKMVSTINQLESIIK